MVPVTFRFGNQSIVLNALLDTAAEESFISTKAVRKFGLSVTDAEVRKRVIMADGTCRLSDMVFQTKLGVGSSFKSSGSFYMLDLPHADMILSWEWMRANKIVIDAGHPRVFAKWRKKMVELPLLVCPTNKQFGAADASLCQVLSYTEAVRDLSQAERFGMVRGTFVQPVGDGSADRWCHESRAEGCRDDHGRLFGCHS
mmetsp:Transcript_17200/g.56989  ORF Transcript_17200/g.56989 Transcript_17200/m.56989 type:complete len:199 (-) Transcript_17200:2737-3333(-)